MNTQVQDRSLAAVGGGLSYEMISPRISALVEEVTPAGAIVMVVSKGDEELVRFDGRTGWHFPRAATGQYAGHHPPDGGWAVDHVESLRADGGAYLVLPATYYWWLEHYPELERHLRSRYEQVPCPEEICRIYRLLELPAAPPRAVPGLLAENGQRRVLLSMRALIANLLPEDDVVLVVSEGDDTLLALDRPAWHFPHDAAGKHVPLEEAGERHAASQLRTLSGNGSRYLVVPAVFFTRLMRLPVLAAYLCEECRMLALRGRVCVVYELRSGSRTSTPMVLGPKEAVRK